MAVIFSSYIAGGEVALVPAVGFVRDHAGEEALRKQQIDILPGRLQAPPA